MPASDDDDNPAMIDRLPLDARVILDVGCGDGALGAEYKRRNPAARYLGIERDPALARIAAGRLDDVAVVDVEATPLPFDGLRYDCIVYNDVLEHLADPWAVLRAQIQALHPTGSVALCIPNLEHWSFADRLLRGTWNYDSYGLMDRGHLRWFTEQSTRRALDEAGLWPTECVPRVFRREQAERFVAALEPALRALGVDMADYLRRAAPLQHVWRATRSEPARLHVVSTMLPPVGGVSQVRVLDPLHALATQPAVTTQVAESLRVPRVPGGAEIFILHRPALLGADGLALVREVMEAGYLTVCEFDDHPDFIPILQHPEMYNFSAVHAVQTTIAPLAAILRRHNPEVAVFPNAAPRLPDVRNYAAAGRINVLFAGLNRDGDWPPYLAALNAAAELARDRLHFQVVNDRAMFDALRTPHKSFTPLCDYPTYQALLSGCEVSFMPLADNPFNRCKSDLKFVEAAAHRVVALASPVAYSDSIEDGVTGLLFRSPQELQQRLLRLVASPETGRGIGDAARRYVASRRMMAYQVAERIAWYRSLWARREALNAALLARLPALAGQHAAGAAMPVRRFGHSGVPS
ncbi:MAG TPA: methyltransferase domain-containing protein [Acetobacteraceae bacterium]|nr:methyltransferase domain-containing protein [Acetobacteraceae bacterium]